MDIKKVAFNTTGDIELDATPAVRRWLEDKKGPGEGHFQIILEKADIKIKGSPKTLRPKGLFQVMQTAQKGTPNVGICYTKKIRNTSIIDLWIIKR